MTEMVHIDLDTQMLFHLLPVGTVLCNRRFITHVNAEFARLFGYEADALIGKSLEMLYPTRKEFIERGEQWLDMLSSNGGHADERPMLGAGCNLIPMRVRGRCMDKSDPFHLIACAFEPIALPKKVKLSPREEQIINAMADGLTSKEIARILNLSHRTVETYRQRLMNRTGAKNAFQLLSLVH
nr:transcriptional regulator, LuxR family [uncultured bacterium]